MKLTELFESLLATRQRVVSTRDSLRTQIDDLQRRREQILRAPATGADLMRAIDSWIESRAAAFEAGSRAQVEQLAREPQVLTTPTAIAARLRLVAAGKARGEPVDVASLDDALCWLLGPQLRDAFAGAIDRMDVAGEPVALDARPGLVAEIDRKLDGLLREAAELEEQAAQAGIRIDS